MDLGRDEVFAWMKGREMLHTTEDIKFVCRCVDKYFEMRERGEYPDREEVRHIIITERNWYIKEIEETKSEINELNEKVKELEKQLFKKYGE